MKQSKIPSLPVVYNGLVPGIVETEVFVVAVSGWQTEVGSFLGWAGSAAGGSPLSQSSWYSASARSKGPPHLSEACGLESRH